MLVFIGLDPLCHVVVVRRVAAIRLVAHLANSLLRTTGFAAAVGGFILFVLADGAFLPVVSCVFLGAVIVLAGEEFDCCSISLSFGDDADAAAISVGEIGRLGSAGAALRDFHSFVRRLREHGHDDGGGGGLAKVAGKAEVGAAGIQIHIVCRAAGQFTVFIRCAALRVAAELQAVGKGEVRITSHQTYSAALARGLIVGDGTLLEGER